MSRRRSLTPDQVRVIRAWWRMHLSVPSVKEMSRLIGADRKAIERCAKGETYRDIQP